jgi:hypothetical protein
MLHVFAALMGVSFSVIFVTYTSASITMSFLSAMKSLTLEALAADKHYVSTVVVLPLKIKGGEASLVRPIAIA